MKLQGAVRLAEERDLAFVAATRAAGVDDRAFGESAAAKFTENVFVEIVAEHLAEIGMLDNPVVCFHQGRFGAGGVRLNGYAVPDDGERLDLIVALFEGRADQRTVPTADIQRVGSQAARALQAAARGDHEDRKSTRLNSSH